ncbi:MAG: YicC/YloC family endoribonuclease, partial [Lachnospiraceae bacterium]|nr:YicC/YloC family endoribonuclease [Lachnospiraceae bacterium]
MVRSMTGYGRSEVSKEDKKIVAEIKSVNNRFLDLTVKMPRKLNPLESKIRDEIKTYIQRGKVDLFITLEDLSDSDEKVKYNHALAQE